MIFNKLKILKLFLLATLFVASLVSCQQSATLELVDGKEGILYTSYEVPLKSGFSVSFRHSVNKSDVEEGYLIRGKDIYLDWCRYSSFGAGVATEVEKGQTLSTLENGDMLIQGFDRHIPFLSYHISTIYDHYLHINGQVINLTDLGLKHKQIVFRIK